MVKIPSCLRLPAGARDCVRTPGRRIAGPATGTGVATVNGGITLEIPSNTNAEVKGSTLTGGISTDFPLEINRVSFSHTLRGTLGVGGPELKLSTISGSIALTEAR